MEYVTNLTTVNYTPGNVSRIKYIVVHYVGAQSSAINNGIYFKSIARNASAHKFVDPTTCVTVVEDKNISWGVGANKYVHPECRNSNCLNLEMCCLLNADGTFRFEQATIDNAHEIVTNWMRLYNIDINHVLRHYDVTGKICPEPWVGNHITGKTDPGKMALWDAFKKSLGKPLTSTTELAVGDRVTIASNAWYGGLTASRGKAIPTSQLNGKVHTIAKFGTWHGVKEALLKEINSWVPTLFLTRV